MSRAPRALLAAAGVPSAATGAYLLVLLGAALAGRRAAPPAQPPPGGWPRLVALVPAHDEEEGIAAALRSLAAADYPAGLVETVVVADNCTDATASVARAEGATVLERRDPDRRGKPHALAWALERLEERGTPHDAVLFVDADCTVTPNLPAAMAARLAAGAQAVQADNVVANPHESASAALRFAAFASICTVRPMGKATLRLSAGLLGTGMLLRRELLERLPWRAFALAEDLEYHLRLVDAGVVVEFAPEAAVRSPMPASEGDAAGQQSRWEAGRFEVARRWAPRMVAGGLRRRDPVRLHAGLELLVPSQSALLAWNVALGGPALIAGGLARKLAAMALAGQLGALAGALLFVRAPRSVWRALLGAPRLAAGKLGLYLRLASHGPPADWERAVRSPAESRAGAGPPDSRPATAAQTAT